jgi:photosynthesis system II assembly factor YCF48-like protein
MKFSQMKVSFSLFASLIGFGVIPSSVSLAQSGWFWQNPLPQGNSLFAVSVLDSDTGTAVGGLGTIRRTTDGGATWTQQTSGTTETLRGVSFVDANTGTAVGAVGTILRTTDGGATWTSQASGTTNLSTACPSWTRTSAPRWAPSGRFSGRPMGARAGRRRRAGGQRATA